MISCVYRIFNEVNKKEYIGSSQNFELRKRDHLSLLRRDKHQNIHLQRSFNKHGDSAFVFEILEVCDKSNLLIKEQEYMDRCKPKYNIALFAAAPGRGRKLSVEARRKMSLAQRNRPPFSDETRRKISEAKRGKFCSLPPQTKEHKRKIAEANRKRAKPVMATRLDDANEVRRYDAIMDARHDGFDPSEIVKCCKGKVKSHKGLRWKYDDQE